jgi:hypothetical protein
LRRQRQNRSSCFGTTGWTPFGHSLKPGVEAVHFQRDDSTAGAELGSAQTLRLDLDATIFTLQLEQNA